MQTKQKPSRSCMCSEINLKSTSVISPHISIADDGCHASQDVHRDMETSVSHSSSAFLLHIGGTVTHACAYGCVCYVCMSLWLEGKWPGRSLVTQNVVQVMGSGRTSAPQHIYDTHGTHKNNDKCQCLVNMSKCSLRYDDSISSPAVSPAVQTAQYKWQS